MKGPANIQLCTCMPNFVTVLCEHLYPITLSPNFTQNDSDKLPRMVEQVSQQQKAFLMTIEDDIISR